MPGPVAAGTAKEGTKESVRAASKDPAWCILLVSGGAREAETPVQVRPSDNMRIRRTWLITVFVIAVCAAGAQWYLLPAVGVGSGFEPVAVARNLAKHGVFANPFGWPTGATAHVPPLYPFMLAAVLHITGDGPAFRVVALCLTLSAHALNAVLLFWLAAELFNDPWIAIIAVALVVAMPVYQVLPAWETMYVSAGVLAFWLLARRRGVAITGLYGGLLLLLNPSTLFITSLIAGFEWRQWKRVAGCLLIAIAVTLPWEIRNYQTFHKIFLVRDNLGLELDLANNDCEAYRTNGCELHPVDSIAEARRVVAMGEVEYNEMRMKGAIDWMKGKPGLFLRLLARRVMEFWFPPPELAPYSYCLWIITALSACGFVSMLRNRAARSLADAGNQCGLFPALLSGAL